MQVSLLLGVPVIALSMVPPLQFTYWQWLALTLAAPVAVWGAWPFHRAALANLRHRTATMDTLISMGVLAAFGWSVYALFLGGAGHEGMRHGFSLTVERGSAGREHLPRGGQRSDRRDPGRPVLRGAGQTPRRLSVAGAAGDGRQGCRGSAG